MDIFKRIDKENKKNRLVIDEEHTEIVGSIKDVLTLFTLLTTQLTDMIPKTLLKSAFTLGLTGMLEEGKDYKTIRKSKESNLNVSDKDKIEDLENLLETILKDIKKDLDRSSKDGE